MAKPHKNRKPAAPKSTPATSAKKPELAPLMRKAGVVFDDRPAARRATPPSEPDKKGLVPMSAAEAEEQTAATRPPKKLFGIFAAQPNPYSAVVRCRWCMTKEGYEALRERKINHPYMLIVVFRKEKDEQEGVVKLKDYQRFLVKLRRGWEQMSFDRPGEYLICATILWCPNKNKEGDEEIYKELWKNIAPGKDDCLYKKTLTDGRSFMPLMVEGFCLGGDLGGGASEQQDVKVEETFFAKDPPQWLAWLANCWCSRPPVDQCHFRRRCLHTFTWKWLVIIIFIPWAVVTRLIGAFFLLAVLGWRHVSLLPIIHPFQMSLDNLDCGEPKGNTTEAYYWLTNSKGEIRHVVLWWFMAPWMWMIAASAATTTYFMRGHSSLAAGCAVSSVIVFPFVVALLILIVYLILLCFSALVRAFRPEKTELQVRALLLRKREKEVAREVRQEQEKREELDRYYRDNFAPLTCDCSTASIAVRDMPVSTRTLLLRFYDLKARVCKPYRRA